MFLEAVKADAGLQEKLKAAGDVDAVVAIAKASGFVISTEELQRAQAEVAEEELEGVAGGTCSRARAVLNVVFSKPAHLGVPDLSNICWAAAGVATKARDARRTFYIVWTGSVTTSNTPGNRPA